VAAARAVDALVVVDGSQAVGWLPTDASEVDAFACSAYKWLMSPRGSAFLALSDRCGTASGRSTPGGTPAPTCTRPTTARRCGWPPDARRFDVSPAWFSWVGTAPVLELVEQIGVGADPCVRRGAGGPVPRRARPAAGGTAIVSTTVEGAAERLERAGIRAAVRAGALRASFHLYSTEADVDAASLKRPRRWE
jgi:selenocysteine lyase/cysteine desulfurase